MFAAFLPSIFDARIRCARRVWVPNVLYSNREVEDMRAGRSAANTASRGARLIREHPRHRMS